MNNFLITISLILGATCYAQESSVSVISAKKSIQVPVTQIKIDETLNDSIPIVSVPKIEDSSAQPNTTTKQKTPMTGIELKSVATTTSKKDD